MNFLHSADWQLGASFARFGAQASVLRSARVETLARALEFARSQRMDGFLIAGDLFEDNHVGDDLVRRVLDLFASVPGLPVFILPGNHDPASGVGSIWMRPAFRSPPANVRVFSEPGLAPMGDGYLLASPLTQKNSTQDPSRKLAPLLAGLPETAPVAGMTHGALMIPGKFKLDDFPVALDAASQSGLDYLALGHWHRWQVYDGGRIVMPGTPEPDGFDQEGGGFVASVGIERRGSLPTIERISLARLRWVEKTVDVGADGAVEGLAAILESLHPDAAKTVLRLNFEGLARAELMERIRGKVDEYQAAFAAFQLLDETSEVFSDLESREFLSAHPLLGEMMQDLSRVELLVTGQGGEASSTSPMSMSEFKMLAEKLSPDPREMDAHAFKEARRLFWSAARKASA